MLATESGSRGKAITYTVVIVHGNDSFHSGRAGQFCRALNSFFGKKKCSRSRLRREYWQ